MLEKYERFLNPEASVRKRLLWAILATLCFSVLANGYSWLNFYPIHDAVDFTIGGPSGRWQAELGRFLIPFYMLVKGHIAVPLISGLLSTLYLGLSTFLTTEILQNDSVLGITLTSGFLSANMFMLEINTSNQYFSDVFLFALLFMCLGMYLIWCCRGWKAVVASAACMFVSFGMYPAFITFAACLAMLAVVREVILAKEPAKAVLCRLLTTFAVMAVAGMIYFVVGRIALLVLGTEPSNASRSIFTAGQRTVGKLWRSTLKNYRLFFQIFLDGRENVGGVIGIATWLLLILGVVLTVRALFKRKRMWALPVVAVVAALFPAISRLVNIFTGNNSAFRTMYAQFLVWPALVCVIYWCLPEKGRGRLVATVGMIVLSVAIIWGNVRYNNGGFTVQRVLNERALYHTGRILEDLEVYDLDKEVAFLDGIHLDSPDDEMMQRYACIKGFEHSTGADSRLAIVRFANQLGYTLNRNRELEVKVRKLPEVKAMPSYPEEGYIREFDDYIVVNLGKK